MKRFVALCLMAVAFATAPAFADFNRGLTAYDNGYYKSALREWLPIAEQGDADAQYNLGFMYRNGQGVPQDYKTALKWYRLSAEQGNKDAQNSLGNMYRDGRGVLQSYKEAAKLYRLPAEQGHARAQSNLALMYYVHGPLRDYVLAHMWYNIAAANGEETSAEYRDKIEKDMTPVDINKAQALAKKCFANNYQGC